MNFKGKNKINPNFSVASMTDIIFLLLIFFMITSTTNSNILKINLPSAKGDSTQKEVISLTITEEGKFFIDENEIEKEKLEVSLISALKQANDSSFVVYSDKETKYKNVVYALSIAKKNSLNIVFATDPNHEK